ncbi:MAG: hypothetical protein U9R64_12545, partial [Pseudomonadota bacterium]|nr:hypothetical protein [Pseudomonadota bacterium]
FHAVDPHTSLTWQKGFKVDDFYAARSRTIPPLPWSNIAPPFSGEPDAEAAPPRKEEQARLSPWGLFAWANALPSFARPNAARSRMRSTIAMMPPASVTTRAHFSRAELSN